MVQKGTAQERISIAGKWEFALDPDSSGIKANWSLRKFTSTINLPGTTDEAKYGQKTVGSDYGILTRAYKYIGPAWYQREITIPQSWQDHEIELSMERVLWESRVFIDGKEISVTSALYTPHKHQLGILKPGKHRLSICVNNSLIYNIGDKGHGYSEYTQSVWNGVVGKIELVKKEKLSISSVKIYTHANLQAMDILLALNRQAGTNIRTSSIRWSLKNNEGIQQSSGALKYTLKKEADTLRISVKGLKNIKAWNEFHPTLYTLDIKVLTGTELTESSTEIGFRSLATNAHKILVNDKVAYIRGNLDCVHFPLTGYPSCDINDWMKIFTKYKEYGLNTVRFHSWCPPEAAFIAADRLGIYIQAEIIWIDWWMTTPQKERPEMYTKGTPHGLGKNPSADAFVQAEIKKILDTYGNHPSFVFFGIGNELGNSDFNIMQKWIEAAKRYDPRHLYAVSTARTITKVDDYMVTHYIPGVGGTYENTYNKTNEGLERNYGKATLPIIAHEVGQYPVYPEWKEIDKYTGVLKARNLEEFRQVAIKNGIASQSGELHQASGKLQQLLYKNLIENILLAPSSAGFQMLSMTDYQGQGEALVGWLDSFWDEKGITTATAFRQHCNAVVPLIRTSSFTYTTNDTIKIGLSLANYADDDIRQKMEWLFKDKNGEIIQRGSLSPQTIKQGTVPSLADLNIPAQNFPAKAGMYTFEFGLADKSYLNSWDFFIFPAEQKINHNEIIVAQEWNTKIDDALAAGKKVLLLAHKLGTKQTSSAIKFSPLFWSSSFFPGQDNETLGSLINDRSQAFRLFPTANFTNWQWYSISNGGKYFKMSDMPSDFRPLVQPVSDFHFNEKLASIFECRTGGGKLLVCGYDLTDTKNRIATQLLHSLIGYMQSDTFLPPAQLDAKILKEKLIKMPVAESVSPDRDQFAGSILSVKCGANAMLAESSWQMAYDKVNDFAGTDYEVANAKVQNNNGTHFWRSKNLTVNLKTPAGIKGFLYLHFVNPLKQSYQAVVNVDGRETLTGDITEEGKWIKVFVMREDTNDGNVVLKIDAQDNKSLYVDSMVLTSE